MTEFQSLTYPFPTNFESLIDSFNQSIKELNSLNREKNEQLKQIDIDKDEIIAKFSLKINESNTKLKEIRLNFGNLIKEWLSVYSSSVDLTHSISFPSKMIGELRKIVHDLSDSLNLQHESIGSGVNRKLIISKKELNDDREIIKGEEPYKKIKKNQDNNNNILKNDYNFEFAPDTVKNIYLKNFNSKNIGLEIIKPEYYGNDILEYKIYKNINDFEFISYKTNDIIIDLEKYSHLNLIENKFEKQFLSFYIKCVNLIGESLFSNQFIFIFNEVKNLTPYFIGSNEYNKIPIKSPTEFIDSFTKIDCFQNKTNLICSNTTTLINLDCGYLIQCGLSIDSDEDNVSPEDILTKIKEIASDPFLVFPIEISFPILIHHISTGKDFSLAINSEGEIFSWGFNSFGQLGQNDRNCRTKPCKINIEKKFVKAECGFGHCLALDIEGKTWVWGRNMANLGQKEIKDRFGKVINFQNFGIHQFKPRIISEIDNVCQISVGQFHNIVLNEKNDLYIWGDNENGQLCEEDPSIINLACPKINNFFKEKSLIIKSFSAGGKHNLLISENKELKREIWSWGDNSKFQCGLDIKKKYLIPTKIDIDENYPMIVKAGYLHSLILFNNNKVYGFGECQNRELGKNLKKKNTLPVLINEENQIKRIHDIYAGFELSVFLCEN